jgi:Zn-dependent protease with chaperone function
MEHHDFDRLIDRLEAEAQRNPAGYNARVALVALAGFLILGVAVGFSLLMIGGVGGLLYLAVVSGASAGVVILLAKLGKGVFLLAIPAWLMLRSTWTMLTTRYPAPAGRELPRESAPTLFQRLDDMRTRMHGPGFRHVLLTDELNAAVVQHPRLGLLGGHENYLLLGLSLLQVLTPDEAMAVVAHEYGHLAGDHGKFGAFIYRLRGAWARMQAMSREWTDWGSRLVAKLFDWYAPFFNAYTFVLARRNEYEADRSSVELVGRDSAASALARINIAARFEGERFWPGINARVRDEAEPPAARSADWALAWRERVTHEERRTWLADSLQRMTDHSDTHPALTDRVRAMGVDPVTLEPPPPAAISAAQDWFGAKLPVLQSALDGEWREAVSGKWRERHAYLEERAQRLRALEQATTPSVDEDWERITITQEIQPDADVLPMVDALLARQPGHVSGLYARGQLLLERGSEAGIDDLERVMAADSDSILPACGAIYAFLVSRDESRALAYRDRWLARSELERKRQAELDSFDPATARLAPADVGQDVLDGFAAAVRQHGQGVRQAFLLRRVIHCDDHARAWVLAVETTRWAGNSGAKKAVDRLADARFPLAVHIVPLSHRNFGRLRKQVRSLGVQPLAIS